MTEPSRLKDGKMGAALAVHVQPEQFLSEIKAVYEDGSIQVGLACPADGDAVNETLTEYLAALLQVPSGNIDILSGFFGDKKLVAVEGISSQAANQLILAAYGE